MKPKVDIIVGGQYGSEAKGKVCAYLAPEYAAAVRGGAENAGHTVIFKNVPYKMQVLPVAWVNPRCRLYIGAGTAFSLGQLGAELEWTKAGMRLRIDPNAVIIEQRHKDEEARRSMGQGIGSTQHGCGAALIDKLWRNNGVKLAGSSPELGLWVDEERVSRRIFQFVGEGKPVMLEGTQGTLLSIDHTPHYPFCTSRNVTASAIAAENGVAPALIRDVILVVRALPIRVGGNSGPTGGKELTWEEVSKRAGRPVEEFTTVTKKRRRIFEFDWKEMDYSVMLNGPTRLALTFVDYFGAENRGQLKFDNLNEEAQAFVRRLEARYGVPVSFISTGPLTEQMIDRRRGKEAS